MQPIDPADAQALSLDALRRIQRTLEGRLRSRPHDALLAVGFGPAAFGDAPAKTLTARVLVRRMRPELLRVSLIAPVESIRLHNPSTGRYRTLRLPIDVVDAQPPRPVGTAVHYGARRASSAAVIRWTSVTPPPADPTASHPDDPRWRWGLLCVAHLFSGSGRQQVRIARTEVCGQQPATIEGNVVAAGNLPGGPDAAVLETGLDRLWLSGLLLDPAARPLIPASDADLLHWIHHGTDGIAHQDGRLARWRLQMYLPYQTIPGLGRLQHVVRFVAQPADVASTPHGADHGSPSAPFGPGTSGSVLVVAGAPLGMQVAAEAPHFRVAYAQLFQAVVPWLSDVLGASRVHLVRVF